MEDKQIKEEEMVVEVKAFFEGKKAEWADAIKDSDNVFKIDFLELAGQAPIASEEILRDPEETLLFLRNILGELDWAPEKPKIRLTSVPSTNELLIRNIRAKHLGTLMSIEGIVRKASEVRPHVTLVKFECPNCATIISVMQLDKKLQEPSSCSCGRRGRFQTISKNMVDAQVLQVEEASDALEGGEQPKKITILLKEDLVDPYMETRTTPGSRIKVVGTLKEIPISSGNGTSIMTRFDHAIEANNIIPMEETHKDILVSPEEEEEIKKIAYSGDVLTTLTNSIAPSIEGNDDIKKIMALQLFGGVRRRKSDGTWRRGDLHVLMVADPSVGKSVMLEFMNEVAPKSRYISGKSTSAAGLIAGVVKDEISGGFGLEAGAMVLANEGQINIDEFEKMNEQDRSSMHQAMEQQQATISKASVQACYSEDTEVLTEDGWKEYADVGNLKIAQHDPKTNTTRFIAHNGLYEYDYKGEMYHFENKRNDILVTPNHKMLLSNYRKNDYIPVNAEEIKFNRFKFRNSSEYKHVNEVDAIIIKKIKHKQKRTAEKYIHQCNDKLIPADLWLEFLGYYLSEGGLSATGSDMSMSQNKGDDADKMETCLRKIAKLMRCKLSKIDCGKYWKYSMCSVQLHTHILQHGIYSKNKTLNMPIENFSKRQLKILYNALMLGDGCSLGKNYGTTSSKLANEFQAIAMLIGKSANMSQYQDKRKIQNGKIRQLFYRISLSDKITPWCKKEQIKKPNYDGKVWCFNTKTGFFVTRRNGKIAIQGNTLSTRTAVLAAANPKHGRFDPSQDLAKQINLVPSLLSRFDAIYVLRDIPDEKRDKMIADRILEEYDDSHKEVVDAKLLKKYVAYAKKNFSPELTKEAKKVLGEYYIEMRKINGSNAESAIAIGTRQLEGMVRFTQAHAKMRLSDEATSVDARVAVSIMKDYLDKMGHEEDGTYDIGKLSGRSNLKRLLTKTIMNYLRSIKGEFNNCIPLFEVNKKFNDRETDDIDSVMYELKKGGEILYPKRGFVRLL